MKGYKITNCAQDKRIGVVGRSLKEVFTKGCQKLKVKHKLSTFDFNDLQRNLHILI